MSENTPLSKDQLERIAVTLSRIRDRLHREQVSQFDEAAHIFRPEVFNDKNK
ncbi:MAG: hypothetical protein ACI9LY_003111 [Arenicella sp.]|jgi:hypothetical protein